MEIIHLVLGKANPDRMNGVNKVVFQLASQQAKFGRNVALWGITKDPVHNYGERDFSTRLFQAGNNPFTLDTELRSAILNKQGKAIFHLHGGWIPTFFSVARFMSKHNIPFVLTPHGAYNTIAMQRNKWIKKIYYSLFESKVLNGARQIHAIGQSEVSGLQAIYANNKSFLLPYGFEYAQDLTLKHKKEHEDFVIGFVGRLDIYTKGLDLLLLAFLRFQQEVPETNLWIVGDSKEKGSLEKRIKELGLRNVKLWGSKYGKEKDDLISKMNVFVHPSRNEGLPTAVLEAATLNVPCVVSEATNVGNYVQDYHAGICIPNEDTAALEGAFHSLYRMYCEDKLEQVGKNAQKMVFECFGWDKLVKAYDNLYK